MFVYIASPYTEGDPVLNVRRSLAFAEKLINEGDTPFCPLLCHLWHEMAPKPYEYWIDYSMAWLPKCDVLIRLKGPSKGADREMALARELQIPVIYSDFDVDTE